METEIDWSWVREKSDEGQMMEVLEKIPRDKWNGFRELFGSCYSLIWFASRSDKNVPALIALINQGADVNECLALIQATYMLNPKIVEILFAAQANVHLQSVIGRCAFDFIFDRTHGGYEIKVPGKGSRRVECAKIFMVNGVRLKTIDPAFKNEISQGFIEFERGVLRCHNVIIVLGLQKRHCYGK